MRIPALTTTVAIAVVLSACSDNTAEDAIQVDGSSTVFPVSEALAEEYQIATGNRVVVGLSGTGGGFQKFCRGETSFSGASRPIRSEEMEACADNGIEYIELPVAMDALANVVNPENDWVDCMSVAELKTMWEPEAQGTITNWNQIRDSFPDRPLSLFGAGTDSGTYDYYTFAITGVEHSSRGDFTATEDDNVTVQGVSTDIHALGFLGVAYLEENRSRLKALAVENPQTGECVAPSAETASDGSYQPLTRPLFMYVNAGHLDTLENVEDFAMYMMNADVAPALVTSTGYLALPDRAFDLGQAKIKARKTGTFFDGGSKVGVNIDDLLAAN